MIDIIEDEEDILMMCEDILDDVICEIFGVPPPTESEKIVKKVLNEIVDESVEVYFMLCSWIVYYLSGGGKVTKEVRNVPGS